MYVYLHVCHGCACIHCRSMHALTLYTHDECMHRRIKASRKQTWAHMCVPKHSAHSLCTDKHSHTITLTIIATPSDWRLTCVVCHMAGVGRGPSNLRRLHWRVYFLACNAHGWPHSPRMRQIVRPRRNVRRRGGAGGDLPGVEIRVVAAP